jgi:hypothetical protein
LILLDRFVGTRQLRRQPIQKKKKKKTFGVAARQFGSKFGHSNNAIVHLQQQKEQQASFPCHPSCIRRLLLQVLLAGKRNATLVQGLILPALGCLQF